jgi:hypothetical protein
MYIVARWVQIPNFIGVSSAGKTDNFGRAFAEIALGG